MLYRATAKSIPCTQNTDREALHAALKKIGVPVSFHPSAEIFGENEPSQYVYDLVSGAVQTYKVLTDGRRQIGTFYLTGDIFGLERSRSHTFSAESITDTKVIAIKRSSLATLAITNAKVARELWVLTGTELQQVNNHVLAMVMTAQERVVGFLLEMARRSTTRTEVDLPMTRQDIADYVGLRIETVSRVFSHLEAVGAIARSTPRHIVLRDASKLRKFKSNL